MRANLILCGFLVAVVCSAGTSQAAHKWGLKEGTPDLKSAGQLAFGPDGVLFIGDAKGAAIFAVDTGDATPAKGAPQRNIDDLAEKLAGVAGLKTPLAVNDLAVNPLTANIFLSLSSGDDKAPALVRINQAGEIALVSLAKVPFLKATLPNPPEDKLVGEGPRARNLRNEAVTDIAYASGKVLVSGVSAAGTPSQIREFAFPFSENAIGTGVEIYHGAHGRMEDNATVRTFVAMNIDGVPSVLAGFTCTPLVRFPITAIESGSKTRGTTVAELGNRNMPLDMIAYKKGDENFLLMSNNNRGVMKISTKDIGRKEGITAPVPNEKLTEGQAFETIKDLEGTVQLDRLSDDLAVVIVQKDGKQSLRTVPLP
ncbi:MAG: hypothetical protein NT069_08490 [Planctomycetota bacterium]|nr:hypothetical protein [Planctomycetota bacterium]